jgi:hypothetical protein
MTQFKIKVDSATLEVLCEVSRKTGFRIDKMLQQEMDRVLTDIYVLYERLNMPDATKINPVQALERVTEINSQLLKSNLKPQDDFLVLEAQEIALEVLQIFS